MSKDDEIINKAVGGLFKGVGNIIKNTFNLSKNALETPSVKGISVGGNQRELEQYYLKCKSDFENSKAVLTEVYDFAITILETAFEGLEKQLSLNPYNLSQPILESLLDVTVTSIKTENLFNFPEIDFSKDIPLSAQIELKQQLATLNLRIQQDDGRYAFWASFDNIIKHLVLALETIIRNDTTNTSNIFNAELIHFTKDLHHNLEQIIISFFTEKNAQMNLFADIRHQLLVNTDVVSGLGSDRTPEQRQTETSKVKLPTEIDLTGHELVNGYLKNTYLENIFTGTTQFSIPLSLRYEHCHIIAGTGHGKTQLIQKLVLDDIDAGRGFMVIDSQGDIIRKISMLKVFDSDTVNSLADKFILIDPEDVEYPVALNMFSLGSNIDNENLSELHKQMLINSSIDLYEYLFGAIFGAELTSKQGTIFRYVAKLMAEIPNATIHTLRHLMEDGKRYQEYIDKLDGSAKDFFTTQFFSTSFAQTKKQILSRLWSVLSNQTLENLFSSKENKVNIFEEMNEGKIILVNTSKSLLQSEGSKILGRFFISMTAQAVIKRATIPENRRNPFMIYIDEAHEYLDEKIEDMLNQARKYKVGFTLSHQNLNQLGSLKHTIFSSTSIKLAGGISAKDSQDLALEMKATKDDLLSVKKVDGKFAEFSCYLKNHFNHAIPLSFDFGLLEKREVLSSEAYAKLIQNIRDKYCTAKEELDFGTLHTTKSKPQSVDKTQITTPVEIAEEIQPVKVIEPIETVEPTKQQKSIDRSPIADTHTKEKVKEELKGRGGLHHKYLQNLVKRLAQERGFHTTLEKPVLDNLGLVDVSLKGFDKNIAVEISVNTKDKWEASNISKCLSANYDIVVLLSDDAHHLDKLEQNLTKEFKIEIKNNRLKFLNPEGLIAFLDDIRAKSSSKEETIAGYKVKVNYIPSTKTEQKIRDESIARVLLG